MFEPSKYQKAIYDKIQNGDENLVIEAVAGSGKTTTLITALDIIDDDKSVLFLAFNKSVVESLTKKVGVRNNVTIKTLHSLGSGLCWKKFGSTINPEKYSDYVYRSLKNKTITSSRRLEGTDYSEWIKILLKLVDLFRLNLVKNIDEANEVAFKHGVTPVDNEIPVALDVIKWGETDVAQIDFTDMIYFPVVKKMDIPTYDFVFIDECQDLNSAERELFLRCVDPDFGRFVCVGDRSQAIYAFSGADETSFKKLMSLPNTITLPLSICYRCDRDIILMAKGFVPQIEAREGVESGVINRDAGIDDVQDGDMVLCRLTAPLVKFYIKLVKSQKKAYIKGVEVGETIVRMLEDTKESHIGDAITVLLEKDMEKLKRISKLRGCTIEAAEMSEEHVDLIDKIDIIKALAGDDMDCTVSEIVEQLRMIFKKDGDGICLSTVHKAKGLESDRVFILEKKKFYVPSAMKNPTYAEQEKNLEYVAITRAKKYLGYIDNVNE